MCVFVCMRVCVCVCVFVCMCVCVCVCVFVCGVCVCAEWGVDAVNIISVNTHDSAHTGWWWWAQQPPEISPLKQLILPALSLQFFGTR